MSEIWYSATGLKYQENEPKYFNSAEFPELVEIEKHWEEIKPELQKFMDEKDAGFQSNEYRDITIQGSWNSLSFMFWGFIISKEFHKKCPLTTSYLTKVKGLISISLSRLAPHSSIARHRGDTNTIIRCHLGTEIPMGLPECGLKVGEEEKGWAKGKWIMFNDAYIHSAWNNSDRRRTVLIIDIIRPEFLQKKRRICARVVSYQLINNKLSMKKHFKESSFFVKYFLFGILFLGLLLYRPLKNFILN